MISAGVPNFTDVDEHMRLVGEHAQAYKALHDLQRMTGSRHRYGKPTKAQLEEAYDRLTQSAASIRNHFNGVAS